MHSTSAGQWDPCPPSKNASTLSPQPPSTSRLARVTSAVPAKRITFYKSGDNQFGGLKMAIHRRSFKCFDALLDDLSQKMPLPFGVRTVTTPRGTHSIKHLEQLQDGGCYLCSDQRQAKPVNMELACKRPAIWHHHGRQPQRPDAPATHGPYRQRRILLVKNSEPGLRRSLVLSRRSARSLKAFLDEVSEAMQFHVRKLYTVEGRKIDNVQSLMTCTGVLVCVGREAFSPLLVDFIRKSSEEKLPGLGTRSPGLGPRTPGNGARSPATQGFRSPPYRARSRASEYSEGPESKKNVNFGLETKKSIIHPRSDSSTRSTRFSLSSDKSYPNSQARPAIINDDIEKRVLVNKDGSLSVEMKVRFRLLNDESLQWSTQIKKSGCLNNECCPSRDAQPRYLQPGQSESCSEPDSVPCDPEGANGYAGQHIQRSLEDNHCPCCYQRREQHYDLWENPAHSHKRPPVPPTDAFRHTHTRVRHTHSSSSSSSCHSRRVVCRRARLSKSGEGSGSEQGQVVQEELCVTEEVQSRVEVEQGEDRVEVCTISRCCSSMGVTTTDCIRRPHDTRSGEDNEGDTPQEELMLSDGEDRPQSTISNSSRILQALKEDQDEEDDDLIPSVSRCCQCEPSMCPASQTLLTPHPASNLSNCSAHSSRPRKNGRSASTSPAPCSQPEREENGSKASSYHCQAATPHSVAMGEEIDRAASSSSKLSQATYKSTKTKTPNPEEEGTADDEDEEIKEKAVSSLSAGGGQSRASSMCIRCGGCKRGTTPGSCTSATSNGKAGGCSSRASQSSHHPLPNQENADDCREDERAPSCVSDAGSHVTAISTRSNKSNLTQNDCSSTISNVFEGRAASAFSQASNRPKRSSSADREVVASLTASATSHRSRRSQDVECEKAAMDEKRSTSALSAKTNLSSKSIKSHKSSKVSGRAVSHDSEIADDTEEHRASALSACSARSNLSTKSDKSNCSQTAATPDSKTTKGDAEEGEEEPQEKDTRPNSGLSAKSAASAKSKASARSTTSHRSHCSHCAKVVSPDMTADDGPVMDSIVGDKKEKLQQGQEIKERAASVMSAKSNLSTNSSKSFKASESALSPKMEVAEEGTERVASSMSAKSAQSNVSVKDPNSRGGGDEGEQEGEGVWKNTGDCDQRAERSASALSAKSTSSNLSVTSHKSKCVILTAASSTSDTAEKEMECEGRTPSAMSGKSNTSAKSSKSHRSKCSGAAHLQDPNSTFAIETNGEEDHKIEQVAEDEPPEDQPTSPLSLGADERAVSTMSAKSKSSAKSSRSQCSKCSKRLRPRPKGPDVFTIQTPEVTDEDEVCAVSVPSEKYDASASKLICNDTCDIPVVETEEVDKEDEEADESTPSTISSKTASTIIAHTATVNGPGRSKSSLSEVSKLGLTLSSSKTPSSRSPSPKQSRSPKAPASSGTTQSPTKQLLTDLGLVVEESETNERASSVRSSKSKRLRKESVDTELPLSQASSWSISLGLPEDQDQETGESDSVKSHISSHTNVSGKSRVKTPSNQKMTAQSAVEVENITESQALVESALPHKPICNGSRSPLCPGSKPANIPTIETSGGSEECEKGEPHRSSSSRSNLSSRSCKSHKSSCKGVKASTPMGNDNEVEIRKSPSAKRAASNTGHLTPSDNRTSSALSSSSAKVRSKTPVRVSPNPTNGESACGKEDIMDENLCVSAERPQSAASACSSTNPKALKEEREEETSNRTSSNLEVEGHKSKADKLSDSGTIKSSVKTSKSKKSMTHEKLCPLNNSTQPIIKVDNSSKSTLSQSLSAPDLLKETMATARPLSQQSKGSAISAKTRSEKSQRCHRHRKQKEEEVEPKLTPAFLPNASPNEVVSDWLMSIPADGCMLSVGDFLSIGGEEEKVVEGEEENPADGNGKEAETEQMEEEDKDKNGGTEKEERADIGDAKDVESDPTPQAAGVTSSHPDPLNFSSESRKRNSSVAVMKVLLSPSLGRCHSLPEMSPVYGRRLGASAKGLLDCLAQLQLIEPAPNPTCDLHKDRNQRFNEIMCIFQSLWLAEPKNAQEAGVVKDQVSPPRSSSGVDMSSGSGGSGKENGNGGGDDALQKLPGVGEKEERSGEEVDSMGKDEAEEEQTKTPWSPKNRETLRCPDSPKATEATSSSDKSFANGSSKSPTDNEQETPEDSGSGTPPTILRASLTKRASQDPDPLWVLHLLKKLEKQFMSHYVDAMAEFKVRWDLDDNVVLDTMISELRDEVSRRIQSSIDCELRKIRGRAGRGGRSPRPPQDGHLSMESTMTERRRRMLAVMKNQSVKTGDSLSDGETTADYSDQRSDDEYCPCDACVRKKMATRPARVQPAASAAPQMMEFDLLKILQLKKDPEPQPQPPLPPVDRPPTGEANSGDSQEEARNLEVLPEEEEEDEEEEEEEEETKEDIVPDVVLEETIPEEDEPGEEEEEVEAGGDTEEAEAEGETGGDAEEAEAEGETGGDAEEAEAEGETGGDTEEAEAEGETGGDTEEAEAEGETGGDTEEAEAEGETGGDTEEAEAEGETGGDTEEAEAEGETGGDAEEAEAEGETGGDTEEAEAEGETGGDTEEAEAEGETGGNAEEAEAEGETGGDTEEVEAEGETGGDTEEAEAEGETGGDSEEAEAEGETGGDSEEAEAEGETGGDTEEVEAEGETGGDTEEVEAEGETGGDTEEAEAEGETGGDTEEAEAEGETGGDSEETETGGETVGETEEGEEENKEDDEKDGSEKEESAGEGGQGGESQAEDGGEEVEEDKEEEEEEEEEGVCQCQATRKEEEEASDEAEEVGGEEMADDEGAENTSGEEGETAKEDDETGGDEGEGSEEAEGDVDGGREKEESGECAVSEVKAAQEGETSEWESGEEEEGEEAPGDAEGGGGEDGQGAGGDAGASGEAEDEEEEDDDGENDGREGEDGRTQEGEGSAEETASPQAATPVVCVTEGEEADGEESDTDTKRGSDTSVTGEGEEAEEDDSGKDGDVEEVTEEPVETLKPDQEDGVEEEPAATSPLLRQHTRASVESQPGSMEETGPAVPLGGLGGGAKKSAPSADEGAAGRGQWRSRSPARVKRRTPKESDVDLADF